MGPTYIAPDVKGKIQSVEKQLTVEYKGYRFEKYPDILEKAKHVHERFRIWCGRSGAKDYDHKNYLNNPEHAVEYERINDLLERLYRISYDCKVNPNGDG